MTCRRRGRARNARAGNADLERWLALARTPKTRARIRRWTLLRRVFLVLAIVAAGTFLLAFVGLISTGVAGLFVPALRVVTDAPWWIVPAGLTALVTAALPWAVASLRLDAARYADGAESVGTITEVVVDTTSDPEGEHQYDLTITAELDDGPAPRPGAARADTAAARNDPRARVTRIRRRVHTAEPMQPRVGQLARFRHNTRDPEDLQDILLLGIVDSTAPTDRS